MKKKFSFDKEYKREECLWGLKPHKCVVYILRFKKSGTVLDLGVGEGRNALFLAKKGFDVTGTDISAVGIRKFKKFAKKLRVKVKGVVGDISEFRFRKKYDVILSIATLHFLEKEQIKKLLEKIKKNTKDGGLNVLTAFTEENPSKKFPYLFKKNELKDLYKEWKIINYKEFLTPLEKHEGKGKLHQHALAILIAQKV